MIWQRLDPYRWAWRAFAVFFTAFEVASADVLDVRVERASVFFCAHLLVRWGTKVPVMAMGASYNAFSGRVWDISHLVSALNVAIAESCNPPADS